MGRFHFPGTPGAKSPLSTRGARLSNAQLDAQARSWLLARIEAHRQQGGLVVLTSHQPLALPGVAHETLTL